MRGTKSALLGLLLASASTLAAQSQPAAPAAPTTAAAPTTMEQVVDHIISREQALIGMLRVYRPMAEIYIQKTRRDGPSRLVPSGDKYFLGRADFSSGVELHKFTTKTGRLQRTFDSLRNALSLSAQFMPEGFANMVFLGNVEFDRDHYHFEYIKREFLGEVRCLVFDVRPTEKKSKGRFIGRIWAEDRDYTIVRLNGDFTGSTRTKFYYHFDSWRTNVGPSLWLPSIVYSEETDFHYGFRGRLRFRAQVRLWGYKATQSSQDQELSTILIEGPSPVRDLADSGKDPSPYEAKRAWEQHAADNVIERMERMGLIAPSGDVDKVLQTVVNNLEVTNNLDIQPEVRCRVLLTSTLESFAIGHTIVLSRGLIDVLPDEATLAALLAHELAHIVLGHGMDTRFAFSDRLLFRDEETFHHFLFGRKPGEENEANQKALEFAKNSPYEGKLTAAALFAEELRTRAGQIPNLISPHIGDRLALSLPATGFTESGTARDSNLIAALPLGSRIKVDPWTNRIEILKSQPTGLIPKRDRIPFEVPPVLLYLRRQASTAAPSSGMIASDSQPGLAHKPE